MHGAVLRTELERLFTLDELHSLARQVLGVEPAAVSDTNAGATYAARLVERCQAEQALEALCDALDVARDAVVPELTEVRTKGYLASAVLEDGAAFGPYRIIRKLGEGNAGIVYHAYDASGSIRLKVLRPEVTRDRRALNRFLTVNRVAAAIEHWGLPWWVTVGQEEGLPYVAHPLADGESLGQYVARMGPMSLMDLRPLFSSILETLVALHASRVRHGALHAGNVLLVPQSDGGVAPMLVDIGSDRLRLTSPESRAQLEPLASLALGAPAPERLLGGPIDVRSDVYAFGALLYEVMSGRSPLAGPAEGAARRLTEAPVPLSQVAPRGWISAQLDELVSALLAPDPRQRPRDAHEVLQALEAAPARAARPSIQMSDEDLDARIEMLLRDPSEDMARHLEGAIDEGADPGRIAEAFVFAGDQLMAARLPHARRVRRELVLRAVRLREKTLRDLVGAEGLVEGLLEDDPNDPEASVALVRLRRAQGKHEEVIEALLGRSQAARTGAEKAELLVQIAKIYEEDLNDTAQALVAYSTAFCEHPISPAYARATERLAGSSQEAWSEVLTSCVEASQGPLERPQKHALLVQMARWYARQVARPDLAVPVLQSVLAEDPRNVLALEFLADIYRTSQSWVELGTVLTAFADATSNPVQARDLRAEAGDILLNQLNEPGHARALYEQVLSEDPGHERASNSLARVFELSGDVAEHARALEQRSQALAGEERYASFCRVGRILEDQLHEPEKALARYEQVLDEAPNYLDALRGADRCCVALGRNTRLLSLLTVQLGLARTPRERVTLMDRIATLYETEFIDHLQAADVREQLLDIEPTHEGALAGLARDLRALKRWRDLVVVYERHMEVASDRRQQVALGLSMGEVFGRYLAVPTRAIESYESVLKVDPTNKEALDALVELRATEGSVHEALEAVEALAATASTPAERAAHQVRAARLLEAAGEGERALERFKAAVDADPSDRRLVAQLREAYVRRKSYQAAVQIMEGELETAQGNAEKGKLCGEMARLLLDGLHEEQRADILARRALEYDPGNATALIVLGDAAFADDQFLVASKHYDRALQGAASLEPVEAQRVAECAIEASLKSDGIARALELTDGLLRLAPDSLEVLLKVSDIHFTHGEPNRALALYRQVNERFADELDALTRGLVAFRLGESARRIGDLGAAERWLREALDDDPSSPEPLRALVELRLTQGHAPQAFELMGQLLDLESDDARVDLLVRMGDLAGQAMHDTSLASKCYLRALTERRDDRRILMKLMQLYSEEKDWKKLVKVILKVAELVDEPRQRAKYLHTAAMVVSRELDDLDYAGRLLGEALALAPDLAEARVEALKLARRAGDVGAVKELLKEGIGIAVEAGDRAGALTMMDELGQLYLEQLDRIDQAIAVAESATQLAPDDVARREHLAALYARDPARHYEKAVLAHDEILSRDPFRAEVYRALRHIHTAAKWGDATWCCCQALHCLGQATADETTFFRRLRSTEPTVARSRADDEVWSQHLTHPDALPLLTMLFQAIQPAVATVCARPLEELGYTDHHRIDADRDRHVVAQSLNYVAEVLGIAPPPLYENTNDPGMVSFLHATTPSLVLGTQARAQPVLDQATAFIAARQVTYFRPGFYVRHLIPTGTELKAWLFSTLALFAPSFRVPPDVEAKAREPLRALREQLGPDVHRYLEREVVPRLIEGGALDLKRWVTAVDLTADRAGLIMCNDLEVAVSCVHATESGVATEQRLEALFRFSVSKAYFELRRLMGGAVDL